MNNNKQPYKKPFKNFKENVIYRIAGKRENESCTEQIDVKGHGQTLGTPVEMLLFIFQIVPDTLTDGKIITCVQFVEHAPERKSCNQLQTTSVHRRWRSPPPKKKKKMHA